MHCEMQLYVDSVEKGHSVFHLRYHLNAEISLPCNKALYQMQRHAPVLKRHLHAYTHMLHGKRLTSLFPQEHPQQSRLQRGWPWCGAAASHEDKHKYTEVDQQGDTSYFRSYATDVHMYIRMYSIDVKL